MEQTHNIECEQRKDDPDTNIRYRERRGDGPSKNTDWRWRRRKGTDTNV